MLRFMTLNVANYDGHHHWDLRRELIVRCILECEADIVALQEIRFNPTEPTSRESYQNMAEQILRHLHEQGAHRGSMLLCQPAMFYPVSESMPWYPRPGEHPFFWEGLAVISRLAVLETGTLFHATPEESTDDNLRITQYVRIDREGEPLYLFNTHFALDAPGLHANVRETLAYLERAKGHPTLLVGDLNATPGNPALEPLRQSGLVDLWARRRPDDPGYTFPASDPQERIDYCWANDELASQIESIEIVGSQPEGGIFPSDHLGIVVTLA